MTIARSRPRAAIVGGSLAVLLAMGVVISPLATAAAYADVTFADTSQSVNYGSDWGTQIKMDGLPCYSCAQGTVTFSYTGPSSGGGTLAVYQNSTPYSASSSVGSYSLAQGVILRPGRYEFSIAFSEYGTTVNGSNNYALTISQAPIGTDLRVVSDPSNPRNAVVSTMLTGDYVSSIGGEAGGPALPAGTWHLTVQDASHKSVFSSDVAQPAGGPPFFSAYWVGVASGPYTASGSFEMVSGAAANFAVMNAADVKFAPTASVPSASPSPSTSSAPAAATSSGTIPAWTLLILGLMLLALLLGATTATIQLARRPPMAAGPDGKPAAANEPAEIRAGEHDDATR